MNRWKVLLIALVVAITPWFVSASTIDYDVERVYMDVNVDMVGSMRVREAIVVKGSLNGFERKITYRDSTLEPWKAGSVDFSGSSFYNARGVDLSKISAYAIDKEELGWDVLSKDYEDFEEVTHAIVGDDGVYTKQTTTDGVDVKVYSPSEGGYIVYYYEYFIDQAVVLHQDVAELCFGFFRLDNDDVKEVHIQVKIADGNTTDVFRFWGRGGLDGSIAAIEGTKKTDGTQTYKGVVLDLYDYRAGEDVTIRMTMDKRAFDTVAPVLNNSKQNALDGIIEYETTLSDKANQKRAFMRYTYYGIFGFSILYLIGLIALWIRIYIKYDKEYDVGFDHKYYREFTDDYNVEVVDYLMNKSISTNAMNASLLNLIYKKNIDFEEVPFESKPKKVKVGSLEMSNSKKDTLLKLVSRDNCSDAENKLLDLLFEQIGKDGKVTLSEITEYSSKYDTAEKFMRGYEKWRSVAKADAVNEDFYENHMEVRGLATLYVVLGLVLLGVMAIVKFVNVPLMVILVGSCTFFMTYIWAFRKWSKKGREHYLKWKAFKNFLLDFGSFKDKEIPEVKLWDKYLVYATVFGIAKEVQKAMKVQLSSMGVDESQIFGPRMFTYGDFYWMNAMSKSLGNAVTTSQSVINEHNANLARSSGSGFGGGLSGGGGFSGGGGGGGGGGF